MSLLALRSQLQLSTHIPWSARQAALLPQAARFTHRPTAACRLAGEAAHPPVHEQAQRHLLQPRGRVPAWGLAWQGLAWPRQAWAAVRMGAGRHAHRISEKESGEHQRRLISCVQVSAR